MPRDSYVITESDIMSPTDYELIRKEKREESILRKRYRQIAIGPHSTITFECWESMWLQIQEMLRIEKGGADQLVDELTAYNPMVPDGRELTATLMFEIDDEVRRRAFLTKLGGVEQMIFIDLDGDRILAEPEQDVDRTSADGKASAVQFLHFAFTATQVEKWRSGAGNCMIRIDHPAYGHAAIIDAAQRRELERDFAV
jgi:predicted SnoaL-like aldol condensation-catalyzing enzyme